MPRASRMVVPMSARLVVFAGLNVAHCDKRRASQPSRENDTGLAFRKDQAHFDRQPDALKIGGFAYDVDGP